MSINLRLNRNPALLLLAFCFSLALATASPGEPAARETSPIRQFAYGKAGEWLYESLGKIQWPSLQPVLPGQSPFPIPADWKKEDYDRMGNHPLFGLSKVQYREKSRTITAFLANFPLDKFPGSTALFDEYFRTVPRSPYLTDQQKGIIRANEVLLRERAWISYLSFRRDDAQVVYYPGRIQFKGGDRAQMKAWLPQTPRAFRDGSRTDFALIQDTTGLLGILNGTFDRVDNFVRWESKRPMRYAGFGYGFLTLLPPQPEMATFALYGDGLVRIGTYSRLPHKEKIRTFVQNRFMVIEDGKLAKDSHPNAYGSYDDNIARSYLFTDNNHRIGYLWSMYTPADVLAPIALKLGVQNMMLLDIHSPISCSLSGPDGPLKYSDFRDYMARSFDLVPDFFRMSTVKTTLLWLSSALKSRIQTHYPREAFQLGAEDYFAVFLRDSPEAKRARSESILSAGK